MLNNGTITNSLGNQSYTLDPTDSTTTQLVQQMSSAGGQPFWDPTTNSFMTYAPGQSAYQGVVPTGDSLFAWGTQGISPLGGSSDIGQFSPQLQINPNYAAGQPIAAPNWQTAVSDTLTGDMLANYGSDPLFNFEPGVSGTTQGSQYMIGTVQQLENELGPNFFSPQDESTVLNQTTGQEESASILNADMSGAGNTAINYNPLTGLSPNQQILAFEGVPLNQVEAAVGGLPGTLFDESIAAPYQSALAGIQGQQTSDQSQIAALQQQINQQGAGQSTFSGSVDGYNFSVPMTGGTNSSPLQQQINTLNNQITSDQSQYTTLDQQMQQAATMTLAQAQENPSLANSYNNYIFGLDINPYVAPPQETTATPQQVLSEYFNTPQYQLLFGNSAQATNPNLSPSQRFQADPGYQFALQQGLQGVQNTAAAQGLLGSGAMVNQLDQYGTNTANQYYQQYLTNLNNNFNQWTGTLQGIANTGASLSTPTASTQTGQALASTQQNLSAQQQATLNALSGNVGNTASNTSSLLANQGSLGASAYTNTAAAQSSASMQAASLYAQVEAANQAASANQSSAMIGAAGNVLGKVAGSLF
jgi:hypothetical protein